jgi:hypothetical protein
LSEREATREAPAAAIPDEHRLGGSLPDTSVAFIARLQRGAGNAAVARWLDKRPDDSVLARQQHSAQTGSSPNVRRPLTGTELKRVSDAESGRKIALTVAAKKLDAFIRRLVSKDPSVSGYATSSRAGLNADDARIARGLHIMKLFPDLYPESTIIMSLSRVLSLFLSNLAVEQPSYLYVEKGPKPDDLAQMGHPMLFFGGFFRPFKDDLAPVLIVMHEYFHFVIQPYGHGEQFGLAPKDYEMALMDPYKLSDFALWIAVGRRVSSAQSP